jgi:hypothetical protein
MGLSLAWIQPPESIQEKAKVHRETELGVPPYAQWHREEQTWQKKLLGKLSRDGNKVIPFKGS